MDTFLKDLFFRRIRPKPVDPESGQTIGKALKGCIGKVYKPPGPKVTICEPVALAGLVAVNQRQDSWQISKNFPMKWIFLYFVFL